MLLTPARALAASLLLLAASCDKAPAGPAPVKLKSSSATMTTNWLEMTAATPEGGFRVGNPDAKVKLVEYASLTCPHCRDFHAEAYDQIRDKYVATGNVSYEYRNFVLNGPDFVASLVARCQGPEPFFGLLKSFYVDQTVWTKPFFDLPKEELQRLAALPQDQQLAAIGTAMKLDEYVRARGIPKAKFEQCLADKMAQDKLTAMGRQATETYKLTGTPGFIINEKTQEGVFTWAQLEPKLQEALQ